MLYTTSFASSKDGTLCCVCTILKELCGRGDPSHARAKVATHLLGLFRTWRRAKHQLVCLFNIALGSKDIALWARNSVFSLWLSFFIVTKTSCWFQHDVMRKGFWKWQYRRYLWVEYLRLMLHIFVYAHVYIYYNYTQVKDSLTMAHSVWT